MVHVCSCHQAPHSLDGAVPRQRPAVVIFYNNDADLLDDWHLHQLALPFAVGPAGGGCAFTALPSGMENSICDPTEHNLGLTMALRKPTHTAGKHADAA